MEPNVPSGMTTLQRIIVPELTRGMNLEQVAEQNGIPLVDVVREWRDYVRNRTQMSPEEQWVLQLLRLENLLNLLTGYVEHTSANDADAVRNMLGIFDQIEKLQNLNKSRLDEVRGSIAILSEQ